MKAAESGAKPAASENAGKDSRMIIFFASICFMIDQGFMMHHTRDTAAKQW